MSRPTLITFDRQTSKGNDVLVPADFGNHNITPRQLDKPPPPPRRESLNDAAVNAPYGNGADEFGTFTWDSQSNEVSIDQAMAQIMGMDSPMIGARLKDFMEQVTNSDRERLANRLRNSLQSGRDFREELQIVNGSQEPLKVRMIGKIVTDLAGQPKTVVCAVHPLAPLGDMSAVETNASTNSIAQVCHDLRSPIGAILGYAQLLLSDSLPDQTRTYVEKINRNCENLLETIENSLNSARQNAVTGNSRKDFSAAELVSDVGEMFEAAGVNRAVQFDYSDADHWTRIKTDRLKVRRVLINLVDNALKFTPAGNVSVSGHITRDAGDVPHLQLTVKDSGVGLDSKQLKRVFDPFYQGAGTEGKKGVGLGLSICQNLTRSLSADLTASSEPGQGSSFSFRVPVDVVKIDDSESVKSTAPPLSALLVGTDNAHNRSIVEALKAQGCGVRWTDRADAVGTDQVASSIALVDCSQEAAALAQIESLRRHSPGLGVVAICDRVSESQAQRLLDAGAGTLLIKPFLEDELVATISQAAGQASRSGAEVPQNLADPMCEAARRADLDGLNNLIDDLEAIDRELAQDFKAMASRMDYDSVLDSLDGDGD